MTYTPPPLQDLRTLVDLRNGIVHTVDGVEI